MADQNDSSKVIYHGFLSGELWRSLDEIEVQINILPQDITNIKKKIVKKLNIIVAKLGSLTKGAKEENRSRSYLARIQLLIREANVLVILVNKYPEIAKDRELKLLKLQLKGSLNNFRNHLNEVLNE